MVVVSLFEGGSRGLWAAERIIFRYGLLERSLSVADLEQFAATGQASLELASYLRLLPPAHQRQLRLALQERLRLSPVAVAQLLYSPLGQELMVQASRFLRPKVARKMPLPCEEP